MKYFVSGDIHGFFDEWQKALKEKGFDLNNPNHKIIICGDLFDRGRQPKEIIDYILAHEDKIILVRGNHEDLLEDMIRENYSSCVDEKNGTKQTIDDLRRILNLNDKYSMLEVSQKSNLQYVVDKCVNYYETEHYIFVHAFIPLSDDWKYDKYWRYASPKRWKEARWINPVIPYKNKVYDPDKIIVCGHWHCSALWHEVDPNKYDEFGPKANFEPFISEHIIAIDACTSYSKKVNVVIIED